MEFRRRLLSEIKSVTSAIESEAATIENAMPKGDFDRHFSVKIKAFSAEVFEEKITNKLNEAICRYLHLVTARGVESSYSTGVVVAGYGEQQFFPELIDFKVDGKFGEFVRVWKAGGRNLNEENAPSSVVVPFAQSDMFQLFMEGITRNHLSFVGKTLSRVLNDKSRKIINAYIGDANEKRVEQALQRKDNEVILKAFFREFSAYVRDEMVRPVIKVIATLPKEEMAAMAEALVEITTLRRKVDSTIESVGGPTDVAVISKGDGLVWMKRKHYFNLDLNRDFLYRKRLKYGGTSEPEAEG